MERTGIKILLPSEFFQTLPEYAEFACKNYLDKKLVYFEILISESAKLVCKIEPEVYSHMISGKEIEISKIEYFGIAAIIGNISMRDIMRDAIPDATSVLLQDHFSQYPNSKYKHDDPLYPVGIAYGNFKLSQRNSDEAECTLNDFGNRISGNYTILVRNKKLMLKRISFKKPA